jgi:hypothetical protein
MIFLIVSNVGFGGDTNHGTQRRYHHDFVYHTVSDADLTEFQTACGLYHGVLTGFANEIPGVEEIRLTAGSESNTGNDDFPFGQYLGDFLRVAGKNIPLQNALHLIGIGCIIRAQNGGDGRIHTVLNEQIFHIGELCLNRSASDVALRTTRSRRLAALLGGGRSLSGLSGSGFRVLIPIFAPVAIVVALFGRTVALGLFLAFLGLATAVLSRLGMLGLALGLVLGAISLALVAIAVVTMVVTAVALGALAVAGLIAFAFAALAGGLCVLYIHGFISFSV